MTLRAALARAFEIADHPLVLAALEPPAPVRRIRFAAADGEPVAGWLLEPQGAGPAPAILYVHAHGGRYDIGAAEVLDGRDALCGPLGPVLAAAGYRVLAIDMPCFGARAGVTESAAAKAALWHGRSLAGRMLGELASALDWLAADPGTDPGRIGVFGLSMGATLGYWLAAVRPDVAGGRPPLLLRRLRPAGRPGVHDRHGIYLVVPGLLDLAANGTIAGLVAPRPQFVGLGDADPLTPPAATAPALAALAAAYRAAGAEAALRVHREPEGGHAETPAMRAAMLAFLSDALR